ncbi:MAG: PQQ-binding-like beta-propeller repeat protein, partial [Planctomycetaceae bacterium]|nr:PQQ-binding-like beta-propeller repeat protein [Planctomycetaceae bacterium]
SVFSQCCKFISAVSKDTMHNARMSPAAAAIACCLVTHFVSATDWPRFRGADGGSSVPNAEVPLTWTATDNILWKTELNGHGSSSPVIFGDHLYLTSFTGYGLDPDAPGNREDLELHVLCFDRNSGKPLWDKAMKASPAEQEATRRVVDHGYATGTPACDDRAVYAYFGVSGLAAYSHDGELLWKVPTGERTAGFGSAASPILFGDLVIMNASIEAGAVIAFNKQTGSEAWRIEGVRKSWTTPLVSQSADGRSELIVSYEMEVRGFDPQTGSELWTCEGIQDYVVPCVVAHDGIAYVLGGRKNQSMAIRLGGSGDVTETHRLWETNIGANVTSPVYHDGHLYWISDRGIANCLDAATGSEVYRERVDTKERVYASTLLAGDRMYLTTRENGVFVIAVGPEYKELAHNRIDGDDSLYNATPVADGGRLLFRTNRFLYCIGTSP